MHTTDQPWASQRALSLFAAFHGTHEQLCLGDGVVGSCILNEQCTTITTWQLVTSFEADNTRKCARLVIREPAALLLQTGPREDKY